MADGRHFKNVFRYISAENHPISTKFGVQMQILVPIITTSQNIKIFVNQSNMAAGRHTENRFLVYFNDLLSD